MVRTALLVHLCHVLGIHRQEHLLESDAWLPVMALQLLHPFQRSTCPSFNGRTLVQAGVPRQRHFAELSCDQAITSLLLRLARHMW